MRGDARPIMSNRIDTLFQTIRERGRPALAAYITAGDPSLERTHEIALALVEAGVELLEYGVPFSDPIADGPVIQRAAQRSLAAGTTVDAILASVSGLRAAGCEVPISLFGAYNPFFHRGLKRLCREVREAGADGLLIPDLPPEEAGELLGHVDAEGIGCTFLAAPTSSPERLRMIGEACRGYVYCVSLRGVTGARAELPPDTVDFLDRVRSVTDRPTLVGFGISRPDHVALLAPHVDAMVVGSAFVRIIEEHATAPDLPERVASLARELIGALGGS
jgi:tryptophan synthase alpha chain